MSLEPFDKIEKAFESEMAKVKGKKIGPTDFSELQTGDILFYSGDYLFSRGTQFLSESIWNHVGMVVNMNELFGQNLFGGTPIKDPNNAFIVKNPSSYFTVESVIPNGVRLLNFSKAYRYENGEPYKGRIAVLRLKDSVSKPADYLARFKDFLFSALGERYANNELLTMGASAFLQTRYDSLMLNNRDHMPPYICTELVYYLTKYTQGYSLVSDAEPLTPQNLYTCPDLELIAELTWLAPEV
jgi:hypothetical protein